MCGIWGFVGSDTVPVDDGWTGLCSLTDRGPDDWGMYVDGVGKVTTESELPSDERSVVLGNRRLSILDLSAAGNQPMVNRDGLLWIIYNGEVYNYRELRADLRDAGYEFTSETDTEVILHAYEEYGEDCVERFRGMFSFAVYDSDRDRVFAARDRFGIKPFYYQETGDHLTFASEVTSLLDGEVVDPELDPVSVDGFLALGYVPETRTIVDGVKSLPAGARLTYDRETGECSVERYWTPSFEADGEPTVSAESVRNLLERSIEFRLRSDVPVGVFLSGGLDSSALVALLKSVDPDTDNVHTFSIGFEHDAYSETDFAELVAREFGTEHVSRTITASDVRSELDDIVAAMDQPTVDGVNTYFVSAVTADSDIKVALSGLGSDELFGGYPSFRTVPRRYQAARVLYTLPSSVRRFVADGIDRIGTTGALDGVSTRKIADAIDSEAPFGAAYMSVRGLLTKRDRRDLLDGTADPVDWDVRVQRDVESTLKRTEAEKTVSDAELSWYMHGQLLRDTDAMSMSHSLEVRVPFLDAPLADHVMRGAVDTTDGEKRLLKDAVEDVVPLEVIERRKSGFVFPFDTWLRDELRADVERSLDPALLRKASIDPDAAHRIKRAFHDGELHWSRLWALVVLSLWVDTHLHGDSD